MQEIANLSVVLFVKKGDGESIVIYRGRASSVDSQHTRDVEMSDLNTFSRLCEIFRSWLRDKIISRVHCVSIKGFHYTKPSWRSAPSWARYLAMNANGYWYWFEVKPIPKGYFWEASTGREKQATRSLEIWRETLEGKPNG